MVVVERARERAQLTAVCDRARAGRGDVVLIEAGAGFGKTALLDLTEQTARERELRVLRARGTHVTRDIPLELLRGLLGRRLATLSPRQRRAVLDGAARDLASALGFAEARPLTDHRLRQAAYWLVAQLAAQEPMVLLVDDVQWADDASVAALVAIGSRLDDLPVALVLTHRPEGDDAVSPALAGLTAAAGVRLHPAPLSRAGVATVLRARLRATPLDEETIDRAVVATGGNPFLVTQFAAALADAPRPLSCDELTELTDGVSRELSSLLTARVKRLGSDAVSLAQAVVILGDGCEIGEASAVAGIPRERARHAAAALASSGIFARERIVAFAHPLVRAAITADLLAADRVRLRERTVAVLLAAGADERRVADHLLHTEPAGSTRAVAALRSAAAAAEAAAAPARAALLRRRAIAEFPGTGAAPELLDETIAAELAAGEFEQAAAHIRQRLTGAVTTVERGDLIRWLGRAVGQTHGIPAAVALLDDELEQLEGEARLRVEAELVWMVLLHPPLSARLQAPVARYAGLAGETPGERAMLAMVGLASCFAPRACAASVAPIVARAFGDGAFHADEPPGSAPYMVATYAILLTEQFNLAERELTRAAQAIRDQGAGGSELVLMTRGLTRLQVGRLGDAEADGLEAIEAGRSLTGTLPRLGVAAAIGVVVDARSERGDDAGAMAILADNGFVGGLGADPQLRALLPRARAHLAAGRPAEALADVRRATASYGSFQDVLKHSASTEALAHVALGDRAAAVEAALPQLHRARSWGTPAALASALRVTGLARGGAAGVAHLEEAVAVVSGTPARLETARCTIALGMLRRRGGHRNAALESLRAGVDLAEQLGARLIAEEARRELRLLGARPRRLAFSGADALTAAERRVAQLAAGGYSNRRIAQELYISRKTVETHLGRIFRKLGIRSRTELADALRSPRRDRP